MASDIFLQLDGIKGESTDAEHQGSIEILSFSWGASLAAGASGGAGGAADRPVFSKLTVHMSTSLASPQLFLACVKGTHIKNGLITVRKAGGSGSPYVTIKLSDVLVDSYAIDGEKTGDDTSESVSLSYGQIEFDYTQVKPDGSSGGSSDAGWDLTNNKAA